MVAEFLLFAEAGGVQRTGGPSKRPNRCVSGPACAPAPCGSDKSAVPGSALRFALVKFQTVVEIFQQGCVRVERDLEHLIAAAQLADQSAGAQRSLVLHRCVCL